MAIKKTRLVSKDISMILSAPPGTTSRNRKISGSIVIDVLCDDVNDILNPITTMLDPQLPQVGNFYVENGQVYRDIYYSKAEPKNDGRRDGYFVLRITYSLEADGFSPEEEKEVQLLSISCSTEMAPYAVPVDLDGKQNVNSIGEYFADPLNVPRGLMTFNFSRKEYNNPWALAMDYWGTINSDKTWGIFDPGYLKIKNILPSLNLTNKQACWTVNYEIQYNSQSWFIEKADAGFFALPDGFNGGNPGRVLNADGSPVDTPVLLDGYGHRLPPGADPVFNRYRVNAYRDFGMLGLISPFELQPLEIIGE